jgi:hypothetical protein
MNPTFTAPPDHGAVHIELHYDVADAPQMRDNSRSVFVPELVTVSFLDGRPAYINAKGRRVVSNRYTNGGFGIEADGTIRPDHAGRTPDRWMAETVAKAMQHPAVLACRPVTTAV